MVVFTGRYEGYIDFQFKIPIVSYPIQFSNEFSNNLSVFSCTFNDSKQEKISYVLESTISESNKRRYDILITESYQGKIICEFDIIGNIKGIGNKEFINDDNLYDFKGIIFPQLDSKITLMETYIYIDTKSIVYFNSVLKYQKGNTQIKFSSQFSYSKTEMNFHIQFKSNMKSYQVEKIEEFNTIEIDSQLKKFKIKKDIHFYNVKNIETSIKEFNLIEINERKNKTDEYFYLQLPLNISQLQFYDSSGNISSSYLHCSSKQCIFQFKGRYLLLGNWKESFSISYQQEFDYFEINKLIIPLQFQLESMNVKNMIIHFKFPYKISLHSIQCDIYNLCDYEKFIHQYFNYWNFVEVVFNLKNINLEYFNQLFYFDVNWNDSFEYKFALICILLTSIIVFFIYCIHLI